jgi:hypothetical protein
MAKESGVCPSRRGRLGLNPAERRLSIVFRSPRITAVVSISPEVTAACRDGSENTSRINRDLIGFIRRWLPGLGQALYEDFTTFSFV